MLFYRDRAGSGCTGTISGGTGDGGGSLFFCPDSPLVGYDNYLFIIAGEGDVPVGGNNGECPSFNLLCFIDIQGQGVCVQLNCRASDGDFFFFYVCDMIAVFEIPGGHVQIQVVSYPSFYSSCVVYTGCLGEVFCLWQGCFLSGVAVLMMPVTLGTAVYTVT